MEDETTEMLDLPTKSLLRVSEVADYFSVSEGTIRLWCAHGMLRYEKPHGSLFISRESIRLFRLRGRSKIMG
jgi:excisionase family DNA binding protein